MTIKLIALDLDGTLLNSEKKISVANQAALAAAHARGVKIVLTTGRPLAAVEPYLAELNLLHADEYAITFNGGLVQTNDGGILDQVGFSYQDVATIRQVTESLGLPLDVVQGGDVYVLSAQRDSLYPTCNPMLNYLPTQFEDLDPNALYNKAVTATEPAFIDAQMSKIPSELHEQFEIFKSRDILLEWSPKGVHKANGLRRLIDHLGLDVSQVMACGDEENDLSMIKWAGLGVVMQNGTAVVKAAADIVTPMTNDEDAVAWAVQHYVLDKE